MITAYVRRTVAAAAVVAAIGWDSIPAAAQTTPLWNGLISYWPFDEGSGDTLGDAATGGFVADNGTLRNGPTWITSGGPFSTGLEFNGLNQDVLIPSSGDLDVGTTAVTLSAWVRSDFLPADIPEPFMGIYDSQADNYVFYLDRSANELRFKVTGSTGAAERPGVPARSLSVDQWHHVMGVFDGSRGSAEIYFNGQLADRHSSAGLLQDFVRAGQTASIGADSDVPNLGFEGTPIRFFQGGLTDIAVWNRALGPAEAQYLYNEGAGNAVGKANPSLGGGSSVTPKAPTAQPVVYLPFDGNLQNQGTGGSAHDATLIDTPGVNDSLYTSAKFAQGLDLRQNPLSTDSGTGQGDYVSLDYTLADQGTISMHFTIDKVYNFQSMWANSSNANDWEAWVYEDGRFAARADRATPILAYSLLLLPPEQQLESNHFAFTWERDGNLVATSIYINGELQGQNVDDWRDPGATFFIGGGTGNHYGSGIYDEFRIYETALTEAEILYLAQNADPVPDLTPGDFNGDGNVDAADYAVWQDGFGTTSGATTATGDADLDGDVDGRDLLIWQRNFGAAGAVAATDMVPEPQALWLLCLGLCAAARRRMRRV